ncbi:phospholipid carrier-dependent glycosyltransferase [uncultured Gulosibacter sp.]|uniref:dolichyl-phosphate-mannose--protein mannosyltransferase n=1 Tax=uncultured Gulosibacter sp. TaxID=1339167 RepID=UPI00288C62A9|nr:phospholipid carrier-dependent glycosyltransferase [uncultured Gulosibacter sp.]
MAFLFPQLTVIAYDGRVTLASSTRTSSRSGSHQFVPTGSWVDDLWARLTTDPVRARRTEWVIIAVLTVVAALIRFIRLGFPQRLVFDEVYYVMDGWSLVNVGYESDYPAEDARDQFAAGNVNGFDPDSPSYVVHPPFGKLLIGFGMQLFGAEHIWAWRVAVAFFGTLAVPLMYLVGRKLLGSIGLAAIGAGFLALDGHAITTSRVSILDGLLMFFVLLGFYFLLLDREQHERQLVARLRQWRKQAHQKDARIPLEPVPSKWSWTVGRKGQPNPTGPDYGPVVWNRPWLVAMAVALALATAIKISGVVFLAAFCLAAVGLDAAVRKREGVTFWCSGALLKQAPVAFVLTIPLALATYLLTWWGWLTTEGGYYRQWAAEAPDRAWTGVFGWVPLPLQSLWHYQSQTLKFHEGLHGDHPYISAAYEWPFLLRPTAFAYNYYDAGEAGCGANECVVAVNSISNPLMYWLGTVAVVFLLLYLFVRPNWRYVLILVGVAAGYLPWLLTGRTSVYQFYVIAWLPFMYLAAPVALQTLAGSPGDRRRGRTIAVNSVFAFLIAAVVVSIWFMPIWTGTMIPKWYWYTTMWLPGWR